MKLIAVLLFSFIAAQSFAQEKLITLTMQQVPLYKVFTSITEQTGMHFSYNSHLFNDNQKTTIKVNQQPLNKVLPLLLPATVSYKLVGKHIIITAYIPPAPQKQAQDTATPQTIAVVDSLNSLLKNTHSNDSISLKHNVDTNFIQEISISDNGTMQDTCLSNVKTLKIKEMNKKIALFVAGLFTTGYQAVAQVSENLTNPKKDTISTTTGIKEQRPFQASFVYPLSTDGTHSIDNEYNFSLNILSGFTGKVNGVEFGTFLNINKYSVNGAQFAGLVNFTGITGFAQSSNAAQFAGWVNYNAKGTAEQFAGLVNIGDSAHIQAASLVNVVKSKSNIQIGGIANVSKSSDVQIASIVNTTKESKTQISGIVNASETTNLQIAGITNRASESSCQIGGIFNKTKKGGFQLGIINVRDTTDGVSLGLINIVKKGGLMELEIGCSEVINTSVSFRSGSNKLYAILSAGVNFDDEFIALGAGLGTEIILHKKIGLNLEGVHYGLHSSNLENYGYGELIQLKPLLNFKPIKHLQIYAGPTFNLSIIDDIEMKIPYSIWNTNWTTDAGYTMQMDTWVGATAGLRFCF
ncbi:MAG: STN domain-containing protein [Bacteroidales bacterium]|jgi:hypothetical protein|nr:STN domain-containing protein [Bacteroidales bacterium]